MSLTLEQLGQQVKAKYPQYGSMSDTDVANAVVQKYPQYQNQIEQPQSSSDWLTKASNFVGSIFPGQQVGKDIGTLGGYIYTKAHDALMGTNNSQFYDLNAPTIPQALGDVAQGALTVATPGLVEGGGAIANIAKSAVAGAGFGATGAVAQGETNVGNVAKQAGLGAVIGGGLGAVTEGVSKMVTSLPNRIMNNLLPQLKNSETVDYAIEHTKLGSPKTMLATSDKAITNYATQIETILNHPDNADKFINGADVVGKTLSEFPNSEYTPEDIFSKIKSQIPGTAKLVTDLQNGELSLGKANVLRQAIDKVTYKTIIDSPEIRAGKELAGVFGNTIRDLIKTAAPETESIFDNFSKEINLNKALNKLVIKNQKQGAIGFKDLLGAIGANQAIPGAGLPTLAAEKVGNMPITKVAAAKTLKAITPLVESTATVGKVAGAIAGKVPASLTSPSNQQ